ncbi:MAG: PspC domain-containing protein [Prevotellaceae bacterium]|jgi:phage shock protein PspC (stress-responsive transcriptional regulator)|nr:PspC domain-containing protein [Prevotellaceae bacterium]
MKNVIKISISGLVFTLEEDGYVLLEKYLNQLKTHYTKQQNGIEVVEGIEERIAELLRERMSTSEEVVSKELIQKVMAIMGKPEDIEGENMDQEPNKTPTDAATENKPKHRLYRNIDDRVLGGVCSGIAAWFNIETLIVRLVFIVLAFFSSVGFGMFRLWFTHNITMNTPNLHFGGGWVIIVYIILWIIVPGAKTVAQKCEMRGERPDFSGIQERVKKGADQFERSVRNASQQVSKNIEGKGAGIASGLGRIIAFCVGLVLLLISIPMLIALPVTMIFSASWFCGVVPSGISSLIAFNGNVFWIKILLTLVILLPFVGMFYGGIKLVFRLNFRRFGLGAIIFTSWILSIIALIIMLIFATRPYYGGVEEAQKEVPVTLLSDTLFVCYANSNEVVGKDIWMEAGASEALLGWFEGEGKSLKAIVYPRINVVRVDSLQPMRIEFTGTAAGRYEAESITRANESIPTYSLQDSLLTLSPDIYSKNNKWQGNMSEVLIYLPKGKQVVLTSPYRHHFDRNAPIISKGASFLHIGPTHPAWSSRMERRWERLEKRWERKWERWERKWER